jgi:acetoin utilization deacetylase AcuC-like enzyme
MRIFSSVSFALPLPEGHRFPAQKYALLRQRVLAAQIVPPDQMISPMAAQNHDLVRAHSLSYVQRVQWGELSAVEIRRIGLPWSGSLVERSRRSVGATIEACRAALEDGIAVSLAGGTHHACRDYGEGFCVFNDSAVAAYAMLAEGRVRRVAVIDCDVHQGNGTAQICHGDPAVFTFSIHAANNFPFEKIPSDFDLELPDKTEDDAYLAALRPALRSCFERAQPDLVIYLAGADPYYDDRLGRLALTKAGLAARDQAVFAICRAEGVPVAITMAGGYARTISDTVDINEQTVRLAASTF